MVAEKAEFSPSFIEIVGQTEPGIAAAWGKMVTLFPESTSGNEPVGGEISPEQQVRASMAMTLERGYKLAAQQISQKYFDASNNLSSEISKAQHLLDRSNERLDFILAEFHFRNSEMNRGKTPSVK